MKKLLIPLTILALAACQSTSKRQSNYVLSKSVGVHIASIYDQYQIGNESDAIAMAKTLVPKTAYDQAYINQMLGMMYTTSDESQAIKYLTKAVDSKTLAPASMKRAIETLSKLRNSTNKTQHAQQKSQAPRDLMPVVRVAPRYPINAAKNGIQGYVVMTFDILDNGSVANINIVESKPRGVFDKEAKRALEVWKYLPAKSKDDLTKRMDQEVRLDFQLN
ncbi:MAG: energy transducer TonB [Psychrobium sp.]